MTRRAPILLALLAAPLPAAASAQPSEAPIAVPSGQPVSLIETIIGAPGPEGLTARFRFLAPEIARETGRISFAEAAPDMLHLCESYALPRLAEPGPQVSQIIISLSDRVVPFGQAAPEATQFFEAYRPEGGHCIWEGF
ncbi:DUF6497 family protein [Actibacterium sp. MT2.3-13A]|uniref:DUF6497 family protein n=1 Tax=Actibacterium sp. MT2.3-13A TaxID=2828332 RepID=UPI0020130CDD|nr:DUF6497 family protein [Actibacterium sp. MT2.3-13A]